jgi:ABC-type branched-subunit amino acid transport system ATPase component
MTQQAPGEIVAAGSSPSPSPVLRAQDVAVHFGGIKAVDGVSMTLTEGLVFGILGPNGSGKSTLLAAMTRLVDLTRGELEFDGRLYHHASAAELPRRGMARTFQTVRLLPDLTVLENVQLGSDLSAWRSTGGPRRGRSARKAATELAEHALQRAGLVGLERSRPDELSYGMQRRVEIARAIAMGPRLLLLDEPTAGMNKNERQEMSELLGRLSAEGLTALLVEHDVQMMVDTCDYLFAMNSGVLIAEGPPQQVVGDSAVQDAYLGKRWHERAGR